MTEPTPVPPIEPPPAPDTSLPLHTPPPPFSAQNLAQITQGAEALVYKSTFLTPHTPCVVKYRPPKPYRHPTLDKRLTKARLLAEARSLVRCRKEGVRVPGILALGAEEGWIVMEWVGGRTVRGVLDGWAHRRERGGGEEDERGMLELMGKVGREVGKLHAIGVCHGDLTTSNLMLAPPSTSDDQDEWSLQGDVYLIDFGLTTASIQDEDKAVDLYVLERAFAATHPAAEPLFQEVLRAYGESYGGARGVLKRLEGVRGRGRKRSMLG
ncbi:non-specific serine/threonine protein kinase [Parastagonospora nodorum]|nr:non-specific serine/threonine protein kinase [Parastagonospora nodorum]KAH3998981.1 non-specific serine/threonine protein kinase [Parastagonospora nodorum]KAH4122931.1 non-specific serine/threonine protein kinase [Parastagonospora nodorum]KAH4285108.1 non-specific serine/threonine protein kinase [Parastagonospora nodorum]KAH4300253.1 non-specific serine/threonine protein kinase [Parastagonospora nodorum]